MNPIAVMWVITGVVLFISLVLCVHGIQKVLVPEVYALEKISYLVK